MHYAQLSQDLLEAIQITTEGNVEWSESHFCPASALTEEEAQAFRVVPLLATEKPPFNSATHKCFRDGCRLLQGAWSFKWTVQPLTLPEVIANLATLRAQRWEAVKSLRDKKVQNGGYKVTVADIDKWFHSDTFSRTQQMGLVMFGAACPAVPWKTLDGSFVTMSQTLANQIFAAAALQDQSVFARAEALKILIYASTDIESVDITTGWPETYQGA